MERNCANFPFFQDDNRGGCRVTDRSEGSLATTASLMGLDIDELRRALTARVMQVGIIKRWIGREISKQVLRKEHGSVNLYYLF